MLEQAFEKNINSQGAGQTVASPGWLTQLGRLWGGKSVRTCFSMMKPLHLCAHMMTMTNLETATAF